MPTLKSPKSKGSDYERELAAHLRLHGIDAHRTPLSGGGAASFHFGAGQPDLTGTPFLWVEAKRTERLNIRAALLQAEKAILKSKAPESPCVITRKNREATSSSLVTLRLQDFLPLYLDALRHRGFNPKAEDPDSTCTVPCTEQTPS